MVLVSAVRLELRQAEFETLALQTRALNVRPIQASTDVFCLCVYVCVRGRAWFPTTTVASGDCYPLGVYMAVVVRILSGFCRCIVIERAPWLLSQEDMDRLSVELQHKSSLVGWRSCRSAAID